MKRLYSLDYLRGVAAFGIMIYHYLSWSSGSFSAETFIGKTGIYGVSIFYILSGLTLSYVYQDKLKLTGAGITSFFKKRIFRIFPLLWLVTIIAILLSRQVPGFTNLLLNLSGLFGFVKWYAYFSPGVWSIGNELVFYVFFPFFMLFTRKLKPLLALTFVLLLGVYLYFTFIKLSPDLTLSEQWRYYINPLNQVFLFLGGFLLGYFLRDVKIKHSLIVFLLISALATYTFYPVTGDLINLVTGVNRLVLTTCCFLVCLCFYKLDLQLPVFLHQPLKLLGEASYSVYLLHPIVYSLAGEIDRHVFSYPDSLKVVLSVCVTLLFSYFTYEYFEKYFMQLGRVKTSEV